VLAGLEAGGGEHARVSYQKRLGELSTGSTGEDARTSKGNARRSQEIPVCFKGHVVQGVGCGRWNR
jgi:hypothetical protein